MSQIYQWSSWKMPKTFVWNAVKSTSFVPRVRVRVRVTLRLEVYHHSVILGDKLHDTHEKQFSSTEYLRLWSLRNILFRERMSLSFAIVARPSPEQSFSGLSSAGLMNIFDCLRFETRPTWTARTSYLFPPEMGWPIYTLRHWIPFLLPPTTRRATVVVFDPAFIRRSKTKV
jgi:hypothetical protein